MFGDHTLSKAMIKVSEEGAKQHELVNQEIGKLAEITGRSWDLVESDLFDKVRRISYLEGAGVFAAGFIGTYAVFCYIEDRKMKKRAKLMEPKSKEKGQ